MLKYGFVAVLVVGVLVEFVFGAVLGGCAHSPNIVAWEQCLATQVQWQPIVTDVAQDLASKDYAALLDDLVVRFGLPAVQCAVESFIHGPSAKPGDSPEAVRAQTWLNHSGARK